MINMSTHQYIQYLERPELISQLDKDVIHQWVDTYPATPIFRVLLAAKYQSEQHPDTATYLEQAAFYVQNRKELKYLLRDWQDRIDAYEGEGLDELVEDPTVYSSLSEKEEKTIQAESDDNIELVDEIEEKQDIIETEDEVIDGVEVSEKLGTLSREEKEASEKITDENTEEYIEKSEKVSGVVVESTDEIPLASDEGITVEDDIEFLKSIGKYEEPTESIIDYSEEWELEAPGTGLHTLSDIDIIDTMLVTADASILLPWVEEFTFSTNVFDVAEKISIAQPSTPFTEKEVEVKVKELPPVETNQPEEKRPRIEEARPKAQEETTKGKYSFDEWLSILEQKKQNPDTAPVFDLPTPEVFNKKEIEDAKASGQAPVAPLKEASKTESGDEMVKQLASNSVSFKIDMATETLAKLYVKQGKNTEAINIYKKLMDKYPKKSSYFANQIENLK